MVQGLEILNIHNNKHNTMEKECKGSGLYRRVTQLAEMAPDSEYISVG